MIGQIEQLLNNHRAEGVYHTHVAMGQFRGKFTFNRDGLEELWATYINESPEGINVGLAEKPQHYLPVLVDVDIKQEDNKRELAFIHTEKHIENVIKTYQSVLKLIVDDLDESHLTCILLTKPLYWIESKTKTYAKNGFHLHFPFIFLNQVDQEIHLIPRVKDELEKLETFKDIGFQNSGDAIDKCACKVPWLLYGAIKDIGMKPYLVSKVFNSKCEEVELEDALKHYKIYDDREKQINIKGKVKEYLPRILSILPYGRDTYEVKNGLINPRDRLEEQDKPKNNDHDYGNIEPSIALGIAKRLLPLLSMFRVEDRNEWMTVGWILYNIGEGSKEALELWCDFSSRSEEQYDESVCIYQWERMTKRNLSLGTLRYYASIDSPERYKELKQELAELYGDAVKSQEEKLIDKCISGDQASFSALFQYLQKDIIKVSEKDDKVFTYYEYDDTTRLWIKNKSINLISKISSTLSPIFKPIQFELDQKVKELVEVVNTGKANDKKEKELNKEKAKKQKELDKKYEREMKEHEKQIQKTIREFEREYKAYKKRIEKIKTKTPANLLEEALRQEAEKEPRLIPYDADPPVREYVLGTQPASQGEVKMDIEADVRPIDIEKVKQDLEKAIAKCERVNLIVNKNLQTTYFLKGVAEYFKSASNVDKEFVEKLKNKPVNLFPFGTKVYDFETGKARDRIKDDYFDFTTDNNLIELTDKDRWTIYNYISSLITNSEMSEEDRDEHVESFIQYMSYCLTGDNHLKKILIMKGASGDNGKTCFLNLFKKVIEDFGVSPQKKVFIESKTDSVHQTELFDLVDKRVAYISELTEKSRFNIDLMKFISGDDGQDGISARKCGLDNDNIKLVSKLMIITNEVPKFDGADKAFLERLFVVDFCNRFEKDGEKAQEILGYKDIFFSYLCEEGHKFYTNNKKFKMSKQSMITTTLEKRAKDSVLAFIQEKVIITENPKDRILRGLFLDEYNSFCYSSELEKVSRNKLYDRLKTEFKIESYNERYFIGVKQVTEVNTFNSDSNNVSSDPLDGFNRD